MSINDDKKGLVLVGVLWIVAVLTVIATSVGFSSRLDMKVRAIRTEELRCKWACRAGIEKAIGVLNEDLKASDCLTDLWSDNDTDFNNISLEGCMFSVKVIDEASKLNINTVTREQLLTLPYMEEDVADAIIDWRDNDETPSLEGVEGGYYENLTFRYKIRNGPFRTIRELLMVRGVTEELLYGEDTNFNGLLDYNERDGDKSPPTDNGDDKLYQGWISYLTCYSYDNNVDADGNTKINISRANERQLESSLGISRSQAQWIVERRGNNQFSSIGDLIENNSPKQPQESSNSNQAQPMDLQTFNSIADKITVSGGSRAPGKININTAPKWVLVALLGDSGENEETAENIISYRSSLMDGMYSISDLLAADLVNISTFKRIANNITTRSEVYTIRCTATADRGTSSGTTLQTEVVVDRSSSPCKTLYWYQGAGSL
jgi:type II secretory pathway component PulK